MKNILIKIFRIYQKYVSTNTKPCCRFIPVCSDYAIEALQRHGTLKGLVLTTKRILKCNPFFKGGYDPVP